MTEQSRDAKSIQPEQDKKQPETVLLTAEELRAIAGGTNVGGPHPAPKIVNATNPKPTLPVA